MNRRRLLRWLFGGGVAVAGWRLYENGLAAADTYDEFTNQGDRAHDSWIMSPGFRRVSWTADGELSITVREDHSIRGFGIRHASKDDPDDDVIREFVRPGGRTYRVDLLADLANMDEPQPPGTYHIYAYRGAVNLGRITEVVGHVTFDITPTPSVVDTQFHPDGRLSLTIRNDGNAPLRVRSIENRTDDLEQNEFDTTPLVSYANEATITTAGPLSEGDTTGQVEIAIGIVPAQTLEITVDT